MIEKKALDVEKTVLIGVITKTQDEDKLREYLEELSFLVYTAGGNVVKSFIQKVSFPNPKTFVGPGKMKQIENYVSNNDVATVTSGEPSVLKNVYPSSSKDIVLPAPKVLNNTLISAEFFFHVFF